MILGFAVVFLLGFFVGGFFGALGIALGVMAKRNVEDMPETPIRVIPKRIPLRESAQYYAGQYSPRA